MDLSMGQMAISVFFLMAVVLISRNRDLLDQHDRSSYRNISVGLITLIVAWLLGVYAELGLLVTVPFLSDPLFLRLVQTITSITGMVLLVTGVSTWLPIFRKHRELNQNKVDRLELIRRVEQVTAVETRTNVILSNVLEHIVSLYPVSGGSVYLSGSREASLTFLATCGSTPLDVSRMEKATLCEREIKLTVDHPQLRRRTILNVSLEFQPDLALPIMINGRLVASFVLWLENQCRLERDELLNLKIVTDIIARNIESQQFRLETSFLKDSAHLLTRLQTESDVYGSIKEQIVPIAKQLIANTRSELFSLVMKDRFGQVESYTMGRTGSLLHNRGHETDSLNFDFGAVHASSGSISVAESFFRKTGMKSIQTRSLNSGGELEAVLCLGSKSRNNYRPRDIFLIEQVSLVILNLIRLEDRARVTRLAQQRMLRVGTILSKVGRNVGSDAIISDCAFALKTLVGVQSVRICLTEPEGQFLRSRAFFGSDATAGTAPEDAFLVLSLLPGHRKALETGVPVKLTNSEKSVISEVEISQVFGGSAASVAIVPIIDGENVIGTISLANGKNLSRVCLDEAAITFVKTLADVIAAGLITQSRPAPYLSHSRQSGLGSTHPSNSGHLRSQIKSSLSGIVGSMEIIRSGNTSMDSRLEHYLSIIDRSAKKIGDAVS